jgi:hypothetical protein
MISEPVEDPEGQAILLAKGAPEEVFRCSHFELDANLSPMDPNPMAGLKEEYASLKRRWLPRSGGGKKGIAGETVPLNHKAEVTIGKSYGFRTFRVTELSP